MSLASGPAADKRRGEAPRGERASNLALSRVRGRVREGARGTPRKVSYACRVTAREWCGDPHQRFPALRSLAFLYESEGGLAV
jgi:hypothetical protein